MKTNCSACRIWWGAWFAVILLCGVALSGCAHRSKAEQDKKTEYHYQLGANFFAEQMIPQAIRELTESLKVDPEYAPSLHLLGFIYMGRRDYARAVDYYKQAVELEPHCFECLNNLGTALMAAGRWEEAVALFEELVNKPTYTSPSLAYNNLGWSYFKLGQVKRAEEALQMAVFLKPEMCLAYYNLGLVQKHQDNDFGALRYFVQATKRCPMYVEPHFEAGQVLLERRDPKAREYFQRCYELGADSTIGDRCRSYLQVYR